ncbi:molybdopterin molybdotransferase MoeA [Rhodococcus triatomae]|uniref:Molybdopterin molybdenumtransferase n=1 Tax=Rhodococcus triatomae TaxID=300028 RepID=A0A1G8EXR3_9NOCA|nr:gephyrin-like molybdotransferase Glp [Rhodococcus triatomae]QNG19325.1 molybdopterin molybdotransferase MoeA [Rhodococcus triatomae]QNG24762.1 molybdopterin molybdotransferase MoeA [Rhodococcus triatomae]SDH74701.1 molybdopterin molybdotransferase [Rhodococcus triatomae]
MGVRSVEEYTAHVAELLSPLLSPPPVRVDLSDALGRVLAEDVHSPVDLPLFRNSQMDGYAVDAASVAAAPVTLPVLGVLAAGPAAPARHTPGTALRIMTGAALPEGADAIVPVEDTAGDHRSVTVHRAREAGEFVRERGSDVRAGMLLLSSGNRLEPRHLAVLAAVGLGAVVVRRRPRVAVITTGAELVDAGTTPKPGQIFDSNGLALASGARANGADVVVVQRSSDDPGVFRALLARAVSAADLVLTSGGVSMGDFEVVKDVLAPLGGQFGHIAMQPGGPQGATVVDGVPVLSFPGNPVSTLVSFEMFARPHLRAAAGLPATEHYTLPLAGPLRSPQGKRQFLRGRVAGDAVELVSGPGSHLVAAMAWADVLIDVPADVTALDTGELVKVVPL